MIISDFPHPHLAQVLDRQGVTQVLRRSVSALSKVPFQVDRITPLRHKPGRRCLIRFDVSRPQSQTKDGRLSILGKMRFKGVDEHGYQVQKHLFESGFDGRDTVGFSVPETLGIDHEHRIWFQRLVERRTVEEVIAESDASPDRLVQRQVTNALVALHQTPIALPLKRYSAAGELEFLDRRLCEVAAALPEFEAEIESVRHHAKRIGPLLEHSPTCVIHRDFYPAQVLIGPTGVCLLDFDLFCEGPRILDAGNYLAHLWELAIRFPKRAKVWNTAAQQFADEFVDRSFHHGGDERQLHAWAWIALARHIWISRRIEDRREFTGKIMAAVCQRAESLCLISPGS